MSPKTVAGGKVNDQYYELYSRHLFFMFVVFCHMMRSITLVSRVTDTSRTLRANVVSGRRAAFTHNTGMLQRIFILFYIPMTHKRAEGLIISLAFG
jgi:hypothetical protein